MLCTAISDSDSSDHESGGCLKGSSRSTYVAVAFLLDFEVLLQTEGFQILGS